MKKARFFDRQRKLREFVLAQECLRLTHAACILMAANPDLSPEDAVDDTCQVFRHVREKNSH